MRRLSLTLWNAVLLHGHCRGPVRLPSLVATAVPPATRGRSWTAATASRSLGRCCAASTGTHPWALAEAVCPHDSTRSSPRRSELEHRSAEPSRRGYRAASTATRRPGRPPGGTSAGWASATASGSLASRVSGSPVTVHVVAGPAMGFLASCKATWTDYDTEGQPIETRTASCSDRIRLSYWPDEPLGDGEGTRLDFGLAIGAFG